MIGRLGPELYPARVPLCFNSSAGGHVRHAVDHYLALLAAAETGELDYEHRARDPELETRADCALDRLRGIAAALAAYVDRGAPDRTLRLASETVPGRAVMTSLSRELEFLISHTVHHFALIAVIAGAHGVTPPPDFGLAPSTLKYQREQMAESCAR